MDRTGRLASGIETAVREAAGLDPLLDGEQAELLRFVTRMAAATESRDLLEPGSGSGPGAPAGAGVAFPPLKRRIRSVPPDKAAQAWIARFRALGARPGEDAGGTGQATCRRRRRAPPTAPLPPSACRSIPCSGAPGARAGCIR